MFAKLSSGAVETIGILILAFCRTFMISADSVPIIPSHIRDGLGKCVVLYHVLDVQTLDAYDLVLTYDLCRELVLRVTPPISNPGVDSGDFQLCLAPVLRAILLLGVPSLSFRQFLFILGKERGVSIAVSIARDDHGLQAQVKPDLLIHS